MTETKNPGEKTLTVTPTKTLTLKRSVEQGMVRQSFSHGRTKAVVVEKVKRRTVSDGKTVEPATVAAPPASTPRPLRPALPRLRQVRPAASRPGSCFVS